MCQNANAKRNALSFFFLAFNAQLNATYRIIFFSIVPIEALCIMGIFCVLCSQLWNEHGMLHPCSISNNVWYDGLPPELSISFTLFAPRLLSSFKLWYFIACLSKSRAESLSDGSNQNQLENIRGKKENINANDEWKKGEREKKKAHTISNEITANRTRELQYPDSLNETSHWQQKREREKKNCIAHC